jgi:hypothetical protein
MFWGGTCVSAFTKLMVGSDGNIQRSTLNAQVGTVILNVERLMLNVER